MNHSINWLIASGLFFLFEAFGVPGIGFLFAGIGCIAAAGAIALGLIADDALVMQFVIFSLITAASAGILWRKLKGWRMNPGAPHYSNIVGTEAVTTEILNDHMAGTVRWSGTLMLARLADPHHAPIEPGTTVIITAIEGNVLIVKAKE